MEKAPLPHSPADVLNASFPLLLELHVSLDSLLQVQDRGILDDDHSYNHGHIWEKIHMGVPHTKLQAMGEKFRALLCWAGVALWLSSIARHGMEFFTDYLSDNTLLM